MNDFNGKKRSELPDEVFGIPQERKYPMPDEKHTRSAIKLFNHVEPKYEEQLAKAVIKNMKKYGIDGSVVGPNNRLRKYLPKDMIKEEYISEGLFNKNKERSIVDIRQDAIKKAKVYLKKCFSRYPALRKGYFVLDELETDLEEWNDINYRKQKMYDFYMGESNSIPIYHNFLTKNYPDAVGTKWVYPNVIEPLVKICDESDDFVPGYKLDCSSNKNMTSALVYIVAKKKYVRESSDYTIDEDDILNEGGHRLTLRIYPILLRGIFSDGSYEYIREKKLPAIINKCKSLEDVKYLKQDRTMSINQMKVLRSNAQGVLNKDPKIMNRVSKSFIKKVESGKISIKDIDEHIKWLEIDYMRMLNDKYNEIKKETFKESSNTTINTVVFDIGDVLVSSNFKELLTNDPEIPNDIVDTLLDLWLIDKDDMDETMDLKTYREIVNKRMGTEFSKYIPKLFKYNIECVNAFDYTIPMIQDLKSKGYKVYYLSNWSAWTHDLLQEAGKFEFLKYMDGGLFSYDAGCMKPDPEIYKLFIEKYRINPEEAVFFDDKEENVLAAKKLGFHAIQFVDHNNSIVYDYLKNHGAIYESVVQNLNEVSRNNRSFNYKSIFGESSDITMEKFIFGSKVKIDMDKTVKEIIETIKPIIYTSKNKQQASRIGLTLKCELESVNHNTICILVLDGSQDARDSKEARLLLSNIQNDCKSKLVGYISKVTIGDGDEGCLYFAINKRYIEKSRKDLLESVMLPNKISETEIEDIRKVISSLNDNNFDDFKFSNIVYHDIKYKSKKPIAFITIRTKSINNYTIGFASLAVNQEYQNQGIGKSLTQKAVQWFKRERGIDYLEWHCLPDNAASRKLANDAGFKEYIAKSRNDYIHYTMESAVSEYGTTAGTMVGTNQPDSVYIVNYMQNNAFSGYKEPRFGICRKGMKDLHVVGGKYNKFHYVYDLDKFKQEVSDIHVYRYKGKPRTEFFDIIKEMGDNDLDLYRFITGKQIMDRSDIKFDGNFIEEENIIDELDAIKACTEACISQQVRDLRSIPILTEYTIGRAYNYYRDIDGVYIQNEITHIRSKSYNSIEEIPEAESSIIKRGYII